MTYIKPNIDTMLETVTAFLYQSLSLPHIMNYTVRLAKLSVSHVLCSA